MRFRIILTCFILLCSISMILGENVKYAGKINGQLIPENDFAAALWGHYESFVIEHDRKPTDKEWENLYNKTWENSTKQIVLRDAYQKYGIKVTEQEVMDTLKANIPGMIRNHPLFKDDNGFNKDVYLQSLDTNKPIDLSWLRESYAQYTIPQQKLKQMLAEEMVIPDKDIRDQYAVNHSSAKAVIFTFFNRKYKPIITNEQIEQYYRDHLQDFARSPKCDIGMTIFPVQPSREDEQYVKVKIDSLYRNLKNGESFQLLASKYSSSVSARKDGDMGYLEITSLPPNVQEQLSNLVSGQFTSPIQLKDSWALYKLDDKTKNLVKLREIRISPAVSTKTKEKTLDQVIKVRSLAEQLNLEKASWEYEMTYTRVNELSKNKLKKDNITFNSSIVDRAIAAKPGYLFEPIYRPDMQAFILLQVLNTQPYQELPLTMVADSIKSILTSIEQRNMAKRAADEFYMKYRKQDLVTMRRSGHPTVDFEFLTVDSKVPTRQSYLVTDAILRMHSDLAITQPIQTVDGCFIGYSEKYRAPNMKYWEKEKIQVANDLRKQRTNVYFQKWMERQLKHARVAKWYPFQPLGDTQVFRERE